MNLINFRGIDKKNAENRKHPHLKIHSHAQREPTHRSAERKQQPSNYTHTYIQPEDPADFSAVIPSKYTHINGRLVRPWRPPPMKTN